MSPILVNDRPLLLIILSCFLLTSAYCSSFEDDFYYDEEEESSQQSNLPNDESDEPTISAESMNEKREVRYPRYYDIASRYRNNLVQMSYDIGQFTIPLNDEKDLSYTSHRLSFLKFTPFHKRFFYFYGLGIGFFQQSDSDGLDFFIKSGLGFQFNQSQQTPFLFITGIEYSPYSLWNNKLESDEESDNKNFSSSGHAFFVETGPTLKGKNYNLFFRLGYRSGSQSSMQEILEDQDFNYSYPYLNIGLLVNL